MARMFRKHKAPGAPRQPFPPELQQVWTALEAQIAHTLEVARTRPDQLAAVHTAAVYERMNDLGGQLGGVLALLCWYQQPAAVQADPAAAAAWQAAYLDRMGLTAFLKGTDHDQSPARAD